MRVDEVTDEPLYRDRVCGIDIGKAGMAATIRVPSEKDPSRRAAETRTFGTTRREVLALADWLRCWQVPAVVMEATSVTGSRSSTGWRPRASSASWRTRGR
jgi:transposase